MNIIPKGGMTLIMGPCLIEDKDHAMRHALFLKGLANKYNVKIIYKSSFLKDNRTRYDAPKGPGIDGMYILREIRKLMPVITDVHDVDHLGWWLPDDPSLHPCDIIQIPAMLSRQTSLLEYAGMTRVPVMIKKGQWMDAPELYAAAEKVFRANGPDIILCERGNVSGGKYQYVDMELLSELTRSAYPVVFDCTHSARSKGHALNMAKAALALGVDGIFAEVHENPDNAPSDGKKMLNFMEAKTLVEMCSQ